jgi:tight adherence protein B
MGRFATREELLAVSGDDKGGPGRIARSLEEMTKGGTAAERAAALLARADAKLTVGEFLLMRIAAGLVSFLVGFVMLSGQPVALAVLAAIVFGWIGNLIPQIVLSRRAKKRQKKFLDQLGDTISLMANSLRAGYSLLQTLEMVSREAPDPIGTEFGRVVREVGLGVGNEEAMQNLLRRVPSGDLDLLVTAINIQREVGGNLAQILAIIGETIRERVRIKGEIAVLTAQQQISGYVISALPLLLAGGIFLMNPSYMMGMFVMPWLCMPIGALVMMVIGFFVMKKITAIEV